MKHLRPILEQAERTAAQLDLSLEQVSGFGNGSYLVEFKERAQGSRQVNGFRDDHGAKGSGSNTAQQRGSRESGKPSRAKPAGQQAGGRR